MSSPIRYMLVTWDGGGVVPPELAIARKLLSRGHSVHVLGDPTLEAEARASGCTFGPYTTAPHRTTRDRSADILRDYAFRNKMKYLDVMLHDFLSAPTPRWMADVRAEIEAHPVDVVLADHMIPSALVVAEALGLPSAALVPNIYTIPTPGMVPVGMGLLPKAGPVGRVRDGLLRWLSRRIFAKALPPLNEGRRAFGLEPVGSMYDQTLRADRVLVLTSPAFDYTSPAVPRHVHWVGAQLDDPTWSEPWQMPWAADDSRPLVLVGLSSTFQDQVPLLRAIVEALGTLPVRALVTLGPAVRGDEVVGTANVVVVPSAPHAEVLRHASVVVTHCGHGTTLKALSAGVPMVCIPMGRDQNDNAARVVHRGAGVRCKPTASAAEIRAAIERVLSSSEHRDAARRLAAMIASGAGCSDPVALLEGIADRATVAEVPAPPTVEMASAGA